MTVSHGQWSTFARYARNTLRSRRQTDAECYRTSADDAGILLPVQRDICGFSQTVSGCLSTGSSFARSGVASFGPDRATPIMLSVKEFSVSTQSPRGFWATVTSNISPYATGPLPACLFVTLGLCIVAKRLDGSRCHLVWATERGTAAPPPLFGRLCSDTVADLSYC